MQSRPGLNLNNVYFSKKIVSTKIVLVKGFWRLKVIKFFSFLLGIKVELFVQEFEPRPESDENVNCKCWVHLSTKEGK